MKLPDSEDGQASQRSSNQSESLSGIETENSCAVRGTQAVPINLNPYQGLKRQLYVFSDGLSKVPINLNPYQGLKLLCLVDVSPDELRVPINLNPYQGLKPTPTNTPAAPQPVPINLNPYQGLKL